MVRPERQEMVCNLLKELRSLEPLKQLFWSELNYQRINQPLSRRGWTNTSAQSLADDPVLFAAGGEDSGFHIIYSRLSSDALLLSHERPVVLKLLQDHPYALFIFSNESLNRWHFINVKYDEQSNKRRLFRRITIGPEERLRTASERISLLDLLNINPDLFGLSPLTIQKAHDDAFDVEAVTKQFFGKYKAIFRILEDDLKCQTQDRVWAHDYALQFLNRIMFLYFIQRKRWLGNDTEFVRSFWEAYKVSGQPKDSFFDRWVKVLFFEAFNKKDFKERRYFPDKINKELLFAPFLNGGLFKENPLDERKFTISDALFQQVFTFLEQYNFTIAEDSPLDQEVAVDPEMIGKVYESLVNVSSETDKRGEAGIFYTPRTEIDLMCRLSLVDCLTNHLGDDYKNHLYEVILAMDQDEKSMADRALAKVGLWTRLSDLLSKITVLDPACGSGSFIVGMLHVLDDLQRRANIQLNIDETGFDRKKRIIGQSLYGVDVMDWACHVAELRLWLALVIDVDFTREELHKRTEPLLPDFTFKIRCGDSLVQEIGGINLGRIPASKRISDDLKDRVVNLKNEKMKYYSNDRECLFKSDKEIKNAELKLFGDILDASYLKIQDEIKLLRQRIERPWERQICLDGTIETRPSQMKLEEIEFQQKIVTLTNDMDRINNARAALMTASDIPFVWDIAFVEILEGEKAGFDIVIGNPPYVRQENISDPRLTKEKVTAENKKDYKAKLMRSVYQAFPKFFGYNSENEVVKNKIDGKSDLYIYFYFHGLSLLNQKGSFCFITSNSWLDVGYGADLQEFLLKHCHAKMVIDNQMKRSFASADVNTVIVLFSVPDDSREWALDKTSRFIMFKSPFEHIISPVIFEEIESQKSCRTTQEYRVYPIKQETLLEEGWEYPKESEGETRKPEEYKKGRQLGKYEGNKWGGKYLRAPDIFFTILEKGKGKLVRLGDVADVRRGFTTGCNEFFYLPSKHFDIKKDGKYYELIPKHDGLPEGIEIEEEYLPYSVLSPRDVDSLLIKHSTFDKHLLFLDQKTKLSGGLNTYIKWGEQQKFNARPSCKSRTIWWALAGRHECYLACNYLVNDYMRFYCSRKGTWFSDNFQEIHSSKSYVSLAIILNSIVSQFFINMIGRSNFGGGLLKIQTYEVSDLLSVDTSRIKHNDKYMEEILINFSDKCNLSIYEQCGVNPALSIREQKPNPLPERKALDDIVFDILGLTEAERNEVYWSVCELVKNRLEKSRSV